MVKCGEQEFQHGGGEIGGECACGVVGSPPVMFIVDICHKQPGGGGVLFSILSTF